MTDDRKDMDVPLLRVAEEGRDDTEPVAHTETSGDSLLSGDDDDEESGSAVTTLTQPAMDTDATRTHSERGRRRQQETYWTRTVLWSLLGLVLNAIASCLPFVAVDDDEDDRADHVSDEYTPSTVTVAVNPWFTGQDVWKHHWDRGTWSYVWIAARCLVNTGHVLSAVMLFEMFAGFFIFVRDDDDDDKTLWIGFRRRTAAGMRFRRYVQHMLRLCLVLYALGALSLVVEARMWAVGVYTMVLGILADHQALCHVTQCIRHGTISPMDNNDNNNNNNEPPDVVMVELTNVTVATTEESETRGHSSSDHETEDATEDAPVHNVD